MIWLVPKSISAFWRSVPAGRTPIVIRARPFLASSPSGNSELAWSLSSFWIFDSVSGSGTTGCSQASPRTFATWSATRAITGGSVPGWDGSGERFGTVRWQSGGSSLVPFGAVPFAVPPGEGEAPDDGEAPGHGTSPPANVHPANSTARATSRTALRRRTVTVRRGP
jgi:hypothetical protein